jgi:hypothetical protein
MDWLFDVADEIRRTGSYSIHNENAVLRRRDLDIRGAEMLQRMIETPAFPLTKESKAVIAHEVFKLITGHECLSMLPTVTEAMYSATELGAKFGLSKNKVGRIAKANGLQPPVGESNEYGTWIRTKSPYSPKECPQFMYNRNALSWFREHSELLA